MITMSYDASTRGYFKPKLSEDREEFELKMENGEVVQDEKPEEINPLGQTHHLCP